MQTYREYKAKQLNESVATAAYQTARGAGAMSANVSNSITNALYALGQHPKNRTLLTRIYRYIQKGIENDIEMPEDEKEVLLQAFPSASSGVNRLARGARRLQQAQPHQTQPQQTQPQQMQPQQASMGPNG
jgi:hypothetical protein